MKALSLKQPWANLIIYRRKIIETRKWNTNYRGDLLICSSKSFDYDSIEPLNNYMHKYNVAFPLFMVPSAKAIGIVEIYDCKPMILEDEFQACCGVYPKAHSFFLRNIRPIKPFTVKGQLNIFNVDVKPEDIIYL